MHNDHDGSTGSTCHLEHKTAGVKYQGHEQEGPTLASISPGFGSVPRGNRSESMYERSFYPQAHMK